MATSNLIRGDTTTIRVLRTINCVVLGYMLFSFAMSVFRNKDSKRKPLELVALFTMTAAFMCCFFVTIEIVFLPLRGTPVSWFECNFFERCGNVTHFTMFLGMLYFFYLRTESIRKRIMLNQFLQSRAFNWGSNLLISLCMAGFVTTCAFIESYPLDDPQQCFFGVPPFMGDIVLGCLAAAAFVFLAIFTYIIVTETKLNQQMRRIVYTCWITTLVGFIAEVLCWVVLNNYLADELWNMVLHIDITLNMFLMVVNLSNWRHRIMYNPFRPTVPPGKDSEVTPASSVQNKSGKGTFNGATMDPSNIVMSKRGSRASAASKPMAAARTVTTTGNAISESGESGEAGDVGEATANDIKMANDVKTVNDVKAQ